MFDMVVAAIGTALFYTYISIHLPEKFNPLKIFYFLMAFLFVIMAFWDIEAQSTNDRLTYLIPNQTVDYNGTKYTVVDVTVERSVVGPDDIFVPEMIWINAVVVMLTVLFILYLYSKEMMLKPLQDVYQQVESQDKSKPKGGF